VQGQALLLHLVKVVKVPVNAGLAVSEHLLNVVLVLFAVGAARERDATLFALFKRVFDHAFGDRYGRIHIGDELIEDLHPNLGDFFFDPDFDLSGAARSLIAKLRERVVSLKRRDCFGVDLFVPVNVLALDQNPEL
jgi:hypothetical protein